MKSLADSNVKLPFQSGFCKSGWHEGTRAKDWRGNPAPVCLLVNQCPCECHTEITRMFEMAGRERTPQDNPEYVPYTRTFWMPSDEPDYGLPEAHPDEVAEDDHLIVNASGRTRKGSLEGAVQRVVLEWLELPVMQRIEGLAVKEIADRVYEKEGAALEKPPSLGAVAAVLDRWEKYGYVLLGTKPVRVVALTPDGTQNGLDWCRARAKKGTAA